MCHGYNVYAHNEIGINSISMANKCRIFLFFQPGTKSARSVQDLDCTRPVYDGGRMNENKENRGTDKTLKEELFST